jgi:hypothetical protein
MRQRSGLIVLSSLDTAYLNGIECRVVAVVARRKSMPVLRRGLMPFCGRWGNFPGSDQTGSREFISSSSLPLARSLQVRRDFFLHEATCHESVSMLRGVHFGRIALGNATFQQSHSRSLIDEEHEDSCGVSRKRGWITCCHLGADVTSDPGCIDTDTSTATAPLSHQRRTRRPTMAPMAAMMAQATAYQIATKAVPSFLQASV